MPDPAPLLRTTRLKLRPWHDDDLPSFAAINADRRVMAHFPATLNRDESDQLAARIRGHFQTHGFGLWAVEVVGVARFVGYVGLSIPRFEAHFTPCVEIGWRIAAEHWNRGYATEGASAALSFGFDRLPQIVSYTVSHNFASRRVMEKLGMSCDPQDDFDHPLLPGEHPLRRHVLYRLTGAAWMDHGRPGRLVVDG